MAKQVESLTECSGNAAKGFEHCTVHLILAYSISDRLPLHCSPTSLSLAVGISVISWTIVCCCPTLFFSTNARTCTHIQLHGRALCTLYRYNYILVNLFPSPPLGSIFISGVFPCHALFVMLPSLFCQSFQFTSVILKGVTSPGWHVFVGLRGFKWINSGYTSVRCSFPIQRFPFSHGGFIRKS